MIKIPKEFSARYSKFIKDQGVEPRLQSYYLKWLRYYLDFCTKYSFKWSEKDSLPAFLIKLKSKNQKPLMLEQAKNAVHLLWDMKALEVSTKQQKGSLEESNYHSGTGDQIDKNSLTGHTHVVAKQTTKVLVETKKGPEEHKEADWLRVYSELESSIKMRQD